MRSFVFIISIFFVQVGLADNNLSVDTVSVQGRAYVEVEPDLVDVSFNLNATKKTLPEAKETVDELYKRALQVIKQFDVPKKDIKLTNIDSRPDYEWVDRKRIFKGHRVSRTLKITLRNLDVYGDALEALVNAGISEINQVSAKISDDTQFKRLAMKKAIAAAKAKAQFLAIEFERQLGKVLIINEGGVQVPQPIFRGRGMQEKAILSSVAEDSAPPSANFGTQRITASVNAVFALQ